MEAEHPLSRERQPARGHDYEPAGLGYATDQGPDPRIAAAVHGALGAARSVLNAGAGCGRYEPRDRYVVAAEPSRTARDRRPAWSAPVVAAAAEHLPFAQDAFEAAMAILTVHTWQDWRRGLRELRRVSSGPVVVLTRDPAAITTWWLADYLPELLRAQAASYPPVPAICEVLGAAGAVTVPIPIDCVDGFAEAFYGRPEALLNPEVRAAQSAWQLSDSAESAAGLRRLSADLASGRWDARNGHLRTRQELLGSIRLIVGLP